MLLQATLQKFSQVPNKDDNFYMVGGIGHLLQYSLFSKNIICLDVDETFLMHLGGLTAFSKFKNINFKYVLLNNNCHNQLRTNRY